MVYFINKNQLWVLVFLVVELDDGAQIGGGGGDGSGEKGLY